MGKTKTLFGLVCLLLVGLTIGYASPITKDKKDLIEKVALTYSSQIGVRELTNRNDGEKIDMYLASTGLVNNKAYRAKTGKGYAWCAAFVTWSLKESFKDTDYQIKIPSGSAWAPSWFTANVIYIKGKLNKVKPDKTDVIGIWSPTEKRIGHVGFVDAWPDDGDYVITVEGNTNAAGSREGDGVYRKRRLKANIHKVSRWI